MSEYFIDMTTLKVLKMAPGEWDKMSTHRLRVVQCLVPKCKRKFPDKLARQKHLKDKHHLVPVER